MSNSGFKDLRDELLKSHHSGFRRLYFKRRKPSTYEASWQRIDDKYIKSWGGIDFNTDDAKPGHFDMGALQLTLRNDDGYFNGADDVKSFFYNSVSRIRTLVKVEAGYLDGETELPTSSTVYVGLINDELPISANNEINIATNNLLSVLDEVPAAQVAGLGSTQTASQILAKIRDHTDGAGTVIFRQFISATNWSIATTTKYYNLATSTSNLEGLSCWEVIKRLAQAENYICYLTLAGGFVFRGRTPNATGTSVVTTTTGGVTTTVSSVVLYNRLESDEGSDTVSSLIGPDGYWTGTSNHAAVKFNNGAINPGTTNYIKFSSVVNSNGYAFAFYWQPSFASSDATARYIIYHDPDGILDLQWNASKFRLSMYSPAPTYAPASVYTFTPVAWSANDLIHLAFSLDPSAGAGQRIRCWQNGVELGITVVTEGQWTGADLNFNLARAAAANANFDELVVFNQAKTTWTGYDTEGGLVYTSSSSSTETTIIDEYKFIGLSTVRNTEFGQTVKDRISVGEAINKIYNRIRLKYLKEDTSSSYYTKQESWTWGDSSSSYKYGVRTLELQNDWMDTTTAGEITDDLYDEFRDAKEEVKITTKYNPLVHVYDRCLLTYQTPKQIVLNGYDWGGFLWSAGVWTKSGSRNINISNKEYKVLSVAHDFDNFSSEFTLREF